MNEIQEPNLLVRPTDPMPIPTTPDGVTLGKQRHFRPIPTLTSLPCGHKLDTGSLPKSNCDICWTYFFQVNMDMTRQNVKAAGEGKGAEVAHVHGSKYVKHLTRLMLRAIEINEKEEAAVAETLVG